MQYPNIFFFMNYTLTHLLWGIVFVSQDGSQKAADDVQRVQKLVDYSTDFYSAR